MVVSLLRSIGASRGLREALPFLEGIVARNPGITVQGALNQAREAGLRFTDTPARVVVNQLKANLEAVRKFRTADLDKLPPDSAFGVSVGLLNKNYSYGFEIRGFNEALGERVTRNVTVVSNRKLSYNEAEEMALSRFDDIPGSGNLANQSIRSTHILRSRLAP